MSERDLGQKLEMRRAFWALGASTRLEVKLSALVPVAQTRNRAGAEEWTDLDVLAAEYMPIGGLAYAVADCKTTKTAATERVFWLRGVADLFGARAAYMTKDVDMPPSTRQLALRLGISVMDRADRDQFLKQAGDARLPIAGTFLDRSTVEKWAQIIATTPKGTEKLQVYRRAIYWVLPRHRNLTQLPLYLQEAQALLRPSDRWAQAVLVDLAWLYLLAVLYAVDETTKLHLSQINPALKQVVVGGEHEIREKEDLKQQIRALIEHFEPVASRRPAEPDIVPPFFDDLVDLVARTARRRGLATEALRVLEFTGVETVLGRGASWKAAFPSSDPLAAKLASDVVRFLCRAAGLDMKLLDIFDQTVEGIRPPPNSQKATSTPSGANSASSPERGVDKAQSTESPATTGPSPTTPNDATAEHKAGSAGALDEPELFDAHFEDGERT